MTDGRLLAIGNFDGVHLGHQHLVRTVVAAAQSRDLLPTVLTFHPHPAAVVGRQAPPVLTAHARKLELLRGIASDLEVLVLEFDRPLSRLSPEAFVEGVLVRTYAAREVIVGENFRFGFERSGDLTTLKTLGERFGFTASAFPLLADDLGVISSTRIRSELGAGRVAAAARLMGRPHLLSGPVVAGAKLGRQLGFPTANLGAFEELLPRPGVYATFALVEDASSVTRHPAVTNVGTRPTAGGGQTTVETHILDISTDLYGRRLSIEFMEGLRDEQKFPDLGALKAQIARDVNQARALLASA